MVVLVTAIAFAFPFTLSNCLLIVNGDDEDEKDGDEDEEDGDEDDFDNNEQYLLHSLSRGAE